MLLSTSIGTYLKLFSPMETVAMLKDVGFTALDFAFFDPKYYSKDTDASFFTELRAYAENKGLVFNQAHAPFPSGVGKPDRDEEIFADIVRSMKNASLLGAKNIVVHPVQYLVYANDGVPEKLFELNVAFYNRLKPYCEEYGIRVAVENMWQDKELAGRCDTRIGHSTCSTPAEFIRYMDALDDKCFTACLDLGHAVARVASWFFNKYPQRLLSKVVSQKWANALSEHKFFTAVGVVLAAMFVDWIRVYVNKDYKGGKAPAIRFY